MLDEKLWPTIYTLIQSTCVQLSLGWESEQVSRVLTGSSMSSLTLICLLMHSHVWVKPFSNFSSKRGCMKLSEASRAPFTWSQTLILSESNFTLNTTLSGKGQSSGNRQTSTDARQKGMIHHSSEDVSAAKECGGRLLYATLCIFIWRCKACAASWRSATENCVNIHRSCSAYRITAVLLRFASLIITLLHFYFVCQKPESLGATAFENQFTFNLQEA